MTPGELCDITGLQFCGPECGCGDNSGLLYFPVCTEPEEFVPEWMNGEEPYYVEKWLRENGHLS